MVGSYKKWKHPLRSNRPVEYFNFWDGETADEIWFTGFLASRGFFERYLRQTFAFFSTLGPSSILQCDEVFHLFALKRHRVFFTGENVHYDVFADYKENFLNHRSIDLSLGFDRLSDNRYLRFPIWILEMFPPNSTPQDIKNVCDRLSHQVLEESRTRFCAMVSGTSTLFGTESLDRRRHMVEAFNSVSSVDCAGRFMRNTNDLQDLFGDNKAEFLKHYKFFICPENISVDGYVTEKVFHAIGSGCVPVYYGSNNNPEPDVLNHDAIIFWNQGGDNTAAVNKVEELWNNPKLYKEFFEQPRLKPNAWEVVAEYFESLEKKLDEICKRC